MLLFLFWFHPNQAVKPNPFPIINTNDRYALNDKAGLFMYDAGFVLILFIAVAIAYGFCVVLKKTCKGN